MYLIQNKQKKFLTKDRTEFVTLVEWEKILIVTTYVTAAQTASRLGFDSSAVITLDSLIDRLVKNLSPLEDQLHELMTCDFTLVDQAKVGGHLEMKAHLESILQENKYLFKENQRMRGDCEKLQLQIEEVGNLLKMSKLSGDNKDA